MKYITNFTVPLAWRRQYCGVFEAQVDGVTYYFLDNEYYFKRKGIYGFYDDAERFSFVPGAVRRNRGDGCTAACRKRECCQPGIGAHINDGLLIPADAGEKDEAAEVVMLLKQIHEALLPPTACADIRVSPRFFAIHAAISP